MRGSPHRTTQKRQHRYYSGKKKRHTLKTQIVAEKSTRRILCLAHGKGRWHDLRFFKESKACLHPDTKAVIDSSFQELQKMHVNSAVHKKHNKNNKLSKDDKRKNREISCEHVPCENIITQAVQNHCRPL